MSTRWDPARLLWSLPKAAIERKILCLSLHYCATPRGVYQVDNATVVGLTVNTVF